MNPSKTTAILALALTCLTLGACGKKEPANASPNTKSELAGGLQENVVPGAMTTAVPARTGTMSSGTANSQTVAGAPPPNSTTPANAH